MKKVVVLLLIVCLVAALAVVRADNKLAGNWFVTLKMDLTVSSEKQWLSGMELEGIQVPCILTFSGDHSFEFGLDREKLPETFAQIREQVGLQLTNSLQDRGVAWLQEQMESLRLGVDLSSILNDHDLSLERLMNAVFQLTGSTFDDLLSRSLEDEMILVMLEGVEQEGSYRVIPAVLFVSDEGGSEVSVMNALVYTCEDGVLTIKNGLLTREQLPMEFARNNTES